MIKENSYDKMSIIYDDLLEHIDYQMWANYIRLMARKHNCKILSILDLACGTGTFLNEFKKEKLIKKGLEQSQKMINKAKAKYPSSGIEFFQADMLSFSTKTKIDLITCLFDSMNYLDSLQKITACINTTNQNLADNGLFIFDAVSQKICKEYFYDYTEKNTINNIYYERHCRYDIRTNVQRSHFVFEIDGEKFEELHEQYIYSFSDIKDSIEKSNMRLIAVYSDFKFDNINRYSERAHFVLGKA